MSHEISVTGRHAHMAYTRELPWHGLGVRVPDRSTPTEAARAAKLDWTCRPISLVLTHREHGRQDTGRTALVRQDLWDNGNTPDAMLGTAPTGYVPVQNADAARVLDGVVQRSGSSFETAGSLHHGQKNWFAIRLGRTEEVARNDPVEMFLVLVNRFDTREIELRLTPVRVVCANTLSFAVRYGTGAMIIPHDMAKDTRNIAAVSDMLLESDRQASRLYSAMRTMARTPITDDQVDAMLLSTFSEDDVRLSDHSADRRREAMTHARFLYRNGLGNADSASSGTVWAALNGITEFLDHGKMDRESRLDSIWFGNGQQAKLRAFKHAMDLVARPGMSRSRGVGAGRDSLLSSLAQQRGARGPSISKTRSGSGRAPIEVVWGAYRANPTRDLRNQLMEHFLPAVRRIATRTHGRLDDAVSLDDLMAAGMFGVLDAIDDFDISQGTSLADFCTSRIRGAILDELKSENWNPNVGRAPLHATGSH